MCRPTVWHPVHRKAVPVCMQPPRQNDTQTQELQRHAFLLRAVEGGKFSASRICHFTRWKKRSIHFHKRL
jgi:hypothetical protein